MDQDERPTHPWCRIAVVIDCTDESVHALHAAVIAARRHHARLTLICVASRPWFTVCYIGMSPRTLESELMTVISRRVAGLAAALPADLPCTTYVRCGRPFREMLRILDRERADVLFIASAGEGSPARALARRRIRRLSRRTDAEVVVLGPEAESRAGGDQFSPEVRLAAGGALTATAIRAEIS